MDALDIYGRTPVQYAAQHGYVKILKVLQMGGADLNQAVSN